MHKDFRISLCCFAAALLAFGPTIQAATLGGDYQLQNVYTPSAGALGPLVPLPNVADQAFVSDTVMGNPQQVLQFTSLTSSTHHGVQLQTNPFVSSSNFSLVLLCSFDLTTTALASKIIDFKNLSADAGLYVNAGTGLLSFNDGSAMPPIGGTPVLSGDYTQIVLTRDATTNVVTVYQDGTAAFSFVDSSGLAILGDATPSGNSFLTLFDDDDANVGGQSAETTNGSLARLRVYDGVLSASEVANLDTVIPEPSTWALLAGGLAIFGFAALRRPALRA